MVENNRGNFLIMGNTIKLNEEELLVSVIGYMLRVMKSGQDYSKFKKEFDHIRHGNYDDFNNEVNVGIASPLVIYAPQELLEKELSHKNYGHWMGMFTSTPALNIFGKKCLNEFGRFSDPDLSIETFKKAAHFEIVIRMHSDLAKLTDDRANLELIIDALFKSKCANSEEIKILQNGRRFINDIKHSHLPNKKRHFKSWNEGLIEFNKAFNLLEKYQIKFRY